MNKTLLRRMIKATAIRDMQGNWWKAFLLSIIESVVAMWAISYLPIQIPSEEMIIKAGNDASKIFALMLPDRITPRVLLSIGVVALLYLFLMAPFSIGMSKYYLRVAKGEKATFRDVFSVFTDLRVVFSSIILTIITAIFTVLSLVIFMIIPVGVMILAIWQNSIMLYQISLILLAVFTVIFVIWISRYRFISYIYANDETGVFATIYKYVKYMKKRNGECLVLGASYFMWFFLISMMPFLSFIYLCLSNTVYAKYMYRFRGELSFGDLENPPPEV
ncbi:MAG: hypothetical protein IJO61_01805 [Oscillospiraceae bacterium]|nr:hypothetical protein [Oscillospiraceae bacterium]MBQ7120282.1 hypothetical protein [Oscillospiraceae bacterium]